MIMIMNINMNNICGLRIVKSLLLEGKCDPAACEMCNAAALTEIDCNFPNPISQIGIEGDIPVGVPTGTPELLACILLGNNNVPNANSCLCQCNPVDENKVCTDWTVVDVSPLEASCNQ